MLEIKYIERGLFAGKPMVTSQNVGSFLKLHSNGLESKIRPFWVSMKLAWCFFFMIFAVIIYRQLLWKKTWKC